MRNWAALMLMTMLAGCASGPTARRSDSPFNDQLFAAQTERISADEVFALSDEMKRYLSANIVPDVKHHVVQQALYDQLYGEGQLKLDYDATMTRNASEAFAAKSGNCLSLVILTAAFAKQLNLSVRFQMVYIDEAWTRSDGFDFFDEHVNITLGASKAVGHMGSIEGNEMTVDFLPPKNLKGLRTRGLADKTIVAMYMNNRAAEVLTQKPIDRAYWWARAAVVEDPQYIPAYNTLGVIYKLHGNLQEARQVFEHILQLEPENTIAMANEVLVLNLLGQTAQADSLAAKLKTIRPTPPFYYFDLGLEAMKKGDFAGAREMFSKQIQRDAFYDQSHFWLGMAYYYLGDVKNARKQLSIALENSTTTSEHEIYAAKLARLQSTQHQ